MTWNMLPVYVMVLIGSILDFAPKASAQNEDYETLFQLCLSTTNENPRLTAITTADGKTNIFFFRAEIEHLEDRHVLPLFAVFDPNTTGLARDYIMGVTDTGTKKIVAVLSDSTTTKEYCTACIDTDLTGYTSTSWDPVRNRWVSLAKQPPGEGFTWSKDLMKWTNVKWITDDDSASYKSLLETFPITDQDDPRKTVWVLISNSATDEDGLRTLLYDTFVPDDNDQQVEQKGNVDASPYVVEYALVNDNSTDHRSRKIVFVQRADYTEYGIKYNTFISGRELTYKGGRLRQMPISTAFGPPTFERLFPSVDYVVHDTVLTCLPPSFVFKIEVEMPIVDGGSGFLFFIDPADDEDYAVTFTINGADKAIILSRYSWFAPRALGPPDSYDHISNSIDPPIDDETVKVLILVDVCIVEYFVLDGLYVGSIIVFPNLSWGHHDFFSDEDTTITNLKFTKYD